MTKKKVKKTVAKKTVKWKEVFGGKALMMDAVTEKKHTVTFVGKTDGKKFIFAAESKQGVNQFLVANLFAKIANSIDPGTIGITANSFGEFMEKVSAADAAVVSKTGVKRPLAVATN